VDVVELEEEDGSVEEETLVDDVVVDVVLTPDAYRTARTCAAKLRSAKNGKPVPKWMPAGYLTPGGAYSGGGVALEPDQ